MTQVRHTPGPWEYRKWRNGPRDSGLCIETTDGKVDVAEVSTGLWDARLIAAAPDMLAALELLVSLDDSLHMGAAHGCTVAFEDARKSILKVRGR